MHKETCKTTKFIDIRIQKLSLSIAIHHHSGTLILFLKFLWHGYCLMGNANVWCHIPSHGILPMWFP